MLVNQLTGANLESLLLFDRDLFANMVVPLGMEKTMVVQAIRRKHGLAPLYHPDPVWMKSELFFWSTENLPIWEKLLRTTQLEYNPIWNTNAHIITKDTTTRDKDTAAQHVQKNSGDVTEKAQHAGTLTARCTMRTPPGTAGTPEPMPGTGTRPAQRRARPMEPATLTRTEPATCRKTGKPLLIPPEPGLRPTPRPRRTI